ncbi:MAG: DUF3089 domain-containing protein [Chitinophagaceae bacterium]
MQRTALMFLAGWVIGLLSCSPRYNKFISSYPDDSKSGNPDYSRLNCWAAHPYKRDPSDSIPAPLVQKTMKDSTVDVFFVHPTTLTSKEDTSWNAAINDARINAKTDYSTILYQASVFNECRVFAPRYRQAHVRSYYTSDAVTAKKAFDLAYQDIRESFKYYLEHENKGRPIIIAAHSQGSTHAQRLLKEFFENRPLKNKLVVAYIFGMYIPFDYFKTLTMCNDSIQTSCLVAWRTYKQGYEPDFVKKEKSSGMVTNPLTWKTTTEHASYELNKGGVITDFSRLRPRIADAKIHDGILWINQPHIPGGFLLRMKNFHVGDINLFYVNIRENVRLRIRSYWKQ